MAPMEAADMPQLESDTYIHQRMTRPDQNTDSTGNEAQSGLTVEMSLKSKSKSELLFKSSYSDLLIRPSLITTLF